MAELTAAALPGGVGLTYAVGLSSMSGRVHASQVRNFGIAQVVLAVALVMPHGSLTAHMVQHVRLLVVAAPLLAMGAPLPTMLWALPERRREQALRLWRASVARHARKWAVWVSAALIAQSVVMLAWQCRRCTRPPSKTGCCTPFSTPVT